MSTDDVIEVEPGPRPGRRRTRRLGVALAVAALVAAAATAVWTLGDGGTAAAGAGANCPASTPNAFSPAFDLAVPVPARPTASGADGRLVPERAPDSVVLCEYGPPAAVATAVGVGPAGSGSDVASSSLSAQPGAAPPATPTTAPPVDLPLGRTMERSTSDPAVTTLLTQLQQATVRPADTSYTCGSAYPADGVTPEYLVGLTYDDGVVWVAGPDVCHGSTNGTTSSELDITNAAVAGLGIGGGVDGGVDGTAVPPVAPSAVPPSPAAPEPGSVAPQPGTAEPGSGAVGSPGGDTPDPLAACAASGVGPRAPAGVLVPFTPTSVRVCHLDLGPDVTGASVVDESADVAARVAAALRALPTPPPDQACAAIGGERWALLFGGEQGAQAVTTQVLVDAGGCGTASSGHAVVQPDAAFFALLDALS